MAIKFLNNLDLQKNQLLKVVMENQPGDASLGNGVEGQVYFDTSVNAKVLKVWNGTAWVEVGGGVLTVASGDTNTITIGGTTANPTVSANTAAVSNGSLNLVTGDAVYDFVTGLGYVESVDVNGSTFITVTDGGTTADPTFAVSLAATGTPSTTTFLRGDNTWAAPLQYAGWTLAGNTGTPQVIDSGNTASILGGTVITTVVSATDTLTINHASVTRTDTTSTASPTAGGTFTAVDSVTSSAEGHITALNLKTVTLPADTNTYPTAFAWTGGTTAGPTGSLTGTSPTVAYPAIPSASATASGVITTTTQTIAGNKTLSGNTSMSGTLSVTSTGQSSFAGQVTVPATPAAATDAASKGYVDQSNVGQSVFQGGYNAATNVPDLDVAPSALIKKGWFWAVTNTGTFFAETVQPGDLIYANLDNPGATFANWTVVQSGQDIAGEGATDGATTKGIAGFNSAHFNVTANGWVSSDIYAGGSSLGIVPSGGANTTFLRGDGTWVNPTPPIATSTTYGTVKLFSDTVQTVAANAVSATASRSYGVQFNAAGQMVVNVPWVDTNSVTSVSASAVNNRLGLAITPTTGAVVAGLSIDTLADITTGADVADSLPIYDVSTTTNKRITVTNLANAANTVTSKTGTIAIGALSGTVTHTFGINTIVQTIDSTGATVFCDITRTATTVVATISSVQTAAITILVQKIG